ncbi:hypothetical protein NUW58_g6107 [Xylaria curta]|uniref:Uncharacterized protein n=1 Tax=Xylaria curta TaxID=42375 RepID=A0ACC1NY86_9PEZI|nr:hypothetical protein NUW58_g6107 [Xylaria curta]
MDFTYQVKPPYLEVVQTPPFDVNRDRNGILQLQLVGPVVHPEVNGSFQFICRVQDSVSGLVYTPRYGARLRATAYISASCCRSGTTVTRGHTYRRPLSDEEKAGAIAAVCHIAVVPLDTKIIRAGIYVGLDIYFEWSQTMFIYIEFEWFPGPWTVQLDALAFYGTPQIRPDAADPGNPDVEIRQAILNELAPYWLIWSGQA